MIVDHWSNTADTSAMLTYLFPLHGEGSTQQQPRELQLYFIALARLHWQKLPEIIRTMIKLAEIYCDVDPFSKSVIPLDALSDRISEINEPFFNYRFEDNDSEDFVEWSRMLEEWAKKIRMLGIHVPEQEQLPAVENSETWNQWALLSCYPFLKRIPPISWIKKSNHRAAILREIFPTPDKKEPISSVTLPLVSKKNIEQQTPTAKSHPEIGYLLDQDLIDLATTIYTEHNFQLMPALGDCLQEVGCPDMAMIEHCYSETTKHIRGCWVLDSILKPQNRHLIAQRAWQELSR